MAEERQLQPLRWPVLAAMLCMAATALLAGVGYQSLGAVQKCSCSHCWALARRNNSSSDIQVQLDAVVGTTDQAATGAQTVLAYIGCSTTQSSSASNSSTAQRFEEVVPDLSQRSEDFLPDVAAKVVELEKQGKGRKIIAYSLFGNTPKYIQGAVENAMLVERDWPGWTFRVYLGDGVPDSVIQKIKMFGGEVVKVEGAYQSRECSIFWRFFALEDRTATRILFRDADSRLTFSGQEAVKEWMASPHFIQVMHDHEYHNVPVMAGAWGVVPGLINPKLVAAWRAQGKVQNGTCKWGVDQDWLQHTVWPAVKQYALQHASWHCGEFGAAEVRGWPTERQTQFDIRVGNVHDVHNHYWGLAYFPECPEKCRRKPEWKHC